MFIEFIFQTCKAKNQLTTIMHISLFFQIKMRLKLKLSQCLILRYFGFIQRENLYNKK